MVCSAHCSVQASGAVCDIQACSRQILCQGSALMGPLSAQPLRVSAEAGTFVGQHVFPLAGATL